MPTFLFEVKKLWKRKTTWFAVFVVVAAIAALFYFQQEGIRQMEATNEKALQDYIAFYEQLQKDLIVEAEILKSQGNTEGAEESLQRAEGYAQSQQNLLERQEAYFAGDWKTFYQKDLEKLEFTLDPANGASMGVEDQTISNFTLRVAREEKLALLESGADPLLQPTTFYSMMPTLYDDFTGFALTSWSTSTNRIGTDGWTILLDFVKVHFVPIILLITIFLFGNTVASELRRKRRGLHFFHVQPVSKSRVFWAKYLAGLTHVLIFSTIFLSIPVLLSLMTRGIGSLNFPVLVYDGPNLEDFVGRTPVTSAEYDTFQFIPLSDYFIQSALLTLGLAIAGFSLYFFLSFWLRHPGATLIVTVGISLAVGSLWVSPYNPFQYLALDRIITQQNRVLLLNYEYTWQLGTGLLLGLGLLLVLLSLLSFRRVQVR